MAAKILYFDDKKQTGEILQKNLELFDYDVNLVSTFRDFIGEIHNETVTYDLLLMDIMAVMPSEEEREWFTTAEIEYMDKGRNIGVVLVEKVRDVTKYINIPILFYSVKSYVKQFPYSKLTEPALTKDIVEKIKQLLKGGEQ
jgi:DNA-binding NtrC family response regulator